MEHTNTAILIGYINKEPREFTAQNGVKSLYFYFDTFRAWTDQGETRYFSESHNVRLVGSASFNMLAKYSYLCRSGAKLYIEGQLRYTGKGRERKAVIEARDVIPLAWDRHAMAQPGHPEARFYDEFKASHQPDSYHTHPDQGYAPPVPPQPQPQQAYAQPQQAYAPQAPAAEDSYGHAMAPQPEPPRQAPARAPQPQQPQGPLPDEEIPF